MKSGKREKGQTEKGRKGKINKRQRRGSNRGKINGKDGGMIKESKWIEVKEDKRTEEDICSMTM